MIKRFIAILSLLVSFCASAQVADIMAGKIPPPALVYDYASILTDAEEQSLKTKLEQYDLSTSNQVAIVTLPTLTDATKGTTYGDQEVALKILRGWGVGQKDKNNGIVILIVKSSDGKEKKIKIEVGYGLEGVVPDITAGQIIDNSIAPNFKAGKYYAGLDAGVDDVIKAAEGKYKAPAGYGSRKKKGGFKTWMMLAVLAFIVLSGMFGGGGRGGTYVSRGGYTGWTGGGGSGWSGGGGGGGGGGFGGFGGGGGGGGGASGSW